MTPRALPAPARLRASLRRALLLLLIGALPARAATPLSARMYTQPETLFVDQMFELHLEIDTGGAQLGDEMSLRNLPGPDRLVAGTFDEKSQREIQRSGQTHHIRHFVSKARAPAAGALTLAPSLLIQIVEQRRLVFGSTWISTSRSINVTPQVLQIRPLPQQGRPADFSGAVGSFTYDVTVDPTTLSPNDLVTVCRTVQGEGWLAPVTLQPLELGDMYRLYPLRETLRDDHKRIATTQVIIPLSTNAHTITLPSFCYFDPLRGTYTVTNPPAVELTFKAREAAVEFTPFRPAAVVAPTTGSTTSEQSVIERLASISQPARELTVSRWVRFGGVFLAFCVLIGLFPRSRWAALLLAIAIGTGAYYAARHLDTQQTQGQLTVGALTRARIAPSQQARELFELAPGATVRLREDAGSWLRIESNRRYGWIPAERVER